jgi:argininosuccinate lyase
VFREPTDKRVETFSESVSFDRRLADDDIDGSIAHARMLAACGLMSVPEADAISQTLEEIRRQIADGQFEFTAAKEDIHLHIEAALTARLGDAGRKLHTARSRNDQVATDLRLYCRRAIDRLDNGLLELQRAFLALAVREQGLVIPGYTHMRRAQPGVGSHISCSDGARNSIATATGWPTAANAPTCCRSARGRSPAPPCQSIATM